MFTGIIEKISNVNDVKSEGGNKIFYFKNPFQEKLELGQSIAHNGVCLTISEIGSNNYSAVAVEETLKVTNLNTLQKGDAVNIERCMKADGRFDGHIVQGHVDCTAKFSNFNIITIPSSQTN